MEKPFIAMILNIRGEVVYGGPVPSFEGDRLPYGYMNTNIYPYLARRRPIDEVKHKKVRDKVYDIVVRDIDMVVSKYRLTLKSPQ